MNIKKALGAFLRRLLDSLGDQAPILCVWCGSRESAKPTFQPPVTLVTCPGCNRLLGYSITLCKHGCDFIEPYGFVPSADCPVHD